MTADGRHSFGRELLSALKIVDRGYADPAQMHGSWAGAMGQNQFMPSTYLGYAVDFDGNGRTQTFGIRCPMCSPPWPITSPARAGTHATFGAAR